MAQYTIKSEYEMMMQSLSLGRSSRHSCQQEEALKHFKEALRIAQKNGFKKDEVIVLLNLTFSLESLRRYEEGIDYGEQGLKIAKEIGDEEMQGHMYDCLGILYFGQDKYSEALEYFKQGFEIALKFDNKRQKMLSYRYLGCAYTALGNGNYAMNSFKKCMELFIQENDEMHFQDCYANLAQAYMDLEKYYVEIAYTEKYLEMWRKLLNTCGEANSSTDITFVYECMKDCERAIDLDYQKLAIAEEIGDKISQLEGVDNIGSFLYCSEPKFLTSLFQSLNIAQEMDGKRTPAGILCDITSCRKKLTSYQEPNQFFNKSLTIAKMIGDKEIEAFACYNLGINHFREGDFQQAIYWMNKCLDVHLVTGNKYHEGRALCLLGAAFFCLAKNNQDDDNYDNILAKAEEYFRKSIDCQDYVFKHLQHSDQLKTNFSDYLLIYNKLLFSILIETDRTQEALLVSDQGRARSLGDCIISQYGISQEQYVSPKPLTYPDVQGVLSNAAYSILHYNMLEGGDIAFIVAKDLLQIVKPDYHSSSQELHNFALDSRKDLNNLDDAVKYTVIIVAAISKAYAMMEIESMNCENRSLDLYVQTFNSHQKRGNELVSLSSEGSVEGETGQEFDPLVLLYNFFVAPVMAYVQHDEITIVPEGPFYIVPFAALRDPNTGKYLSETKRIRLAPSIAVLRLLQECPADYHCQQGALIIGDPDVREVILRGKKTKLPPLPKARHEAEIIAHLLHEEPLTGEKATKDVVLKKLREGVALIHIAAHGSSDNGEIALAPNPSSSGKAVPEEEDYLLTMKEVQEIGVRAKLVVLSCCHSGRGRVKGEGMIGLSRAFLAAGARAVVASLWAIDDQATFSFMVSFYGNLKQGESASVSLDRAMKDVRKEKGRMEPKYWAPFFLIGDDVTLHDKMRQ